MNISRKVIVQLLLAGLSAFFLGAVVPGAPAEKLSAAVNYTYRLVLPNVASDGVP